MDGLIFCKSYEEKLLQWNENENDYDGQLTPEHTRCGGSGQVAM